MPFTLTTLSTMVAQLASRLGDSSQKFWPAPELLLCLHEALRLHGAASLAFRARVNFPTTANEPFYSLPSLIAELSHTVTDRDIISRVQRHLREPATGSSWTGTDQFTLAQLTESLQRRLDTFLVETGIIVTSTTTSAPVQTERYTFPESVLEIRRLAIRSTAGAVRVLRETDDRYLKGYAAADLATPGTPRYFSRLPSPRVSVGLVPTLDDAFRLHSLTINGHARLDPENVATILGVPDDLTPAFVYGVLADCLGTDGQAYDPIRAQYCEGRWDEWLVLAKLYPTILGAQINGRAVGVESLTDLDAANPRWQSTTATGVPVRNVYVAGSNLIALEPIPSADDDPHSITLDVVSKAVISDDTAEEIQVTRDQEEAILRYAQHVAELKKGADRLKATEQHYNDLLELAASENERLMQRAGDFVALRRYSKKEDERNPSKAA